MSLQLPREPRPGEPITASMFAQLMRYVRSITPRPGENTRVSIGPNGAVVHASGGRGGPKGGGGEALDHPFKGINASAGGDPRVRVVFGIVNNIIPTIYDAVTGEDVPLDGLTDDPPRPPVLATPTDGVVYLKTVWSDEPIVNHLDYAIIEFADAVPEDEGYAGHKLLFTVTLNDDDTAVTSINQGVTSSLDVQRVKCGGLASYFFNGITS